MGRYVGLQTVTSLHVDFKKSMTKIIKKIAQISTNSGSFEQWHFQIYLWSIFFVMGELHWSLILFVAYLGILHMFLILNW